jgi:2-polyprenyl-3-methyl-5-hydroxy-6-metoxy-1,4-benzoquinol methylase
MGERDPYWAVLTDPSFRAAGVLEAEKLEAFLDSGRQYVARIWEVIESHLGGQFTAHRALDFGCGVGRIVIPLANRCGSVLGVDVAESMLTRAHDLCEKLNLPNAHFVKTDDSLSGVEGTFDLVHSFIVFQHIPPQRGLGLLQQLISRLNENGVGVLHLVYDNPDMNSLVDRVLKSAWRWLKRPFQRVPQMQMNAYPLKDVFRLLQGAGIRQIHVLPTDHGGCLGLTLCFQKTPNACYLA